MGRSVVIFGSIRKSIFLCLFDVFLDLVILAYFNAISTDFYVVKCFICIKFVQFPCLYVGEGLYKRFKCLLEDFFYEFFYVFRVALMHEYVLEHIVSLYYITA